MVGFSPATREVRVRFPANAAQLNLGLRFPPLDCQKSEKGDQGAAGRLEGGFGKPVKEQAASKGQETQNIMHCQTRPRALLNETP